MSSVRGTSLIECLVALAVLAIGAAANATWIMRSMATDARASRIVAAVGIASSLEARMRANRDAALAGRYAGPVASRGSCRGGCDPAGIAARDLHAFHDAVARHLGPAGAGSVHCEADACRIALSWNGGDVLVWPFIP